ncbi:NAD(P)-binding protein [Durotheca rogersii]|uniref:NAD(P)-binding protein n=1 Tax=Durotheca rogersii TaxID=419775 RepID=UPI00221F2E11|nr:NAD(P)-binding protein [Durotheca rogersii]KAI5865619.1 NAD(P)-binding protein [Durotheca rogersii]
MGEEISSRGTVLITGLNGYLAGRVAESVLKAGYSVRGTVRNMAAGNEVKKVLRDMGYGDAVEVVYVRDMAEAGAFDEAVIGCSSILHLAAPVDETWTLEPPALLRMVVNSTTGILNSALKAGAALQSVVLMSSSAANFDVPPEPGVYSEKDWNKTSEAAIEKLGRDAGGLHAYCGSKTAAERLFWRFHDENKPAFSMTTIQATYFIGPPLVPWKKERIPYSLSPTWKLLQGEEVPGPMLLYEATIDVRDVARVIVWAALPEQHAGAADGERFLCSSAVGNAQAIADILNERLPALQVARGTPGHGYEPDYSAPTGGDIVAFDGSKAVAATGQPWIPYETSIVDTALFLKRNYLG